MYVKSHDSVYRAVAAGLYPAGGGVLRTFNSIPKDLRDQLRVIYETKAYTPHAFAALPSVDSSIVEKIALVMRQIDPTSHLLKALGMSGIDSARDEQWNDVRALGLSNDLTSLVKGEEVCRSD